MLFKNRWARYNLIFIYASLFCCLSGELLANTILPFTRLNYTSKPNDFVESVFKDLFFDSELSYTYVHDNDVVIFRIISDEVCFYPIKNTEGSNVDLSKRLSFCPIYFYQKEGARYFVGMGSQSIARVFPGKSFQSPFKNSSTFPNWNSDQIADYDRAQTKYSIKSGMIWAYIIRTFDYGDTRIFKRLKKK